MKKNYIFPEITYVALTNEDILTASVIENEYYVKGVEIFGNNS